ncbi:hypothetical protein EYF80_020634 [Liparis tanakae]|uniref:Uncharacterized protein n=1 Tax=Liparis tanakae TaxID=230148 RepID=A0A4Z2HU13_9TELE|nr:hypothetical protein EYF80_020634 [Liparis tanakae]
MRGEGRAEGRQALARTLSDMSATEGLVQFVGETVNSSAANGGPKSSTPQLHNGLSFMSPGHRG